MEIGSPSKEERIRRWKKNTPPSLSDQEKASKGGLACPGWGGGGGGGGFWGVFSGRGVRSCFHVGGEVLGELFGWGFWGGGGGGFVVGG